MGALDIFANQNDILQAGDALLKYGSSQYDRNSASNGILSYQVHEHRIDRSAASEYPIQQYERSRRSGSRQRVRLGKSGIDIREIKMDIHPVNGSPINLPQFNIDLARRRW